MKPLIDRIAEAWDIAVEREGDIRVKEFLRAIQLSSLTLPLIMIHISNDVLVGRDGLIYVALSGLRGADAYDSQGFTLGYPITPLRG